MKWLASFALLCAAAAAFPGCSSAALRASPSEALEPYAREVFGDVERLQFGKRIQVELPARLAVADVNRDDDRARRLAATVDALAEDGETWKDVGSLQFWSDERTKGSSLFEDYRAAASRQQADILLLADRRESVRSEGNALAFLKILILPMLFLPTEEVRSSLELRAAAVDVRNGLVYATVDHHGEAERTVTAAGKSSAVRGQADDLYAEALPKLREQMARKLRALEKESMGTR